MKRVIHFLATLGGLLSLTLFAGAVATQQVAMSDFMLSLMGSADGETVRGAIGCGTIATQSDDSITVGALIVGGASDLQGDVTISNLTTPLAVTDGGTEANTASGARTSLGLAIGTNVQAYDADLSTYAGITPSANVQSLLACANYSAMRTALTLVPGTDVAAYDADLPAIAALSGTGTAVPTRTASNTWTTQTITSGTYQPTLTNTTNVAASTTGDCNYIRVGNFVFVTGTVQVDPTSQAATVMKVSLPVASNLAGAADASGVVGDTTIYTGSTGMGVVIGDATADAASLEWGTIQGTANRTIQFTFSYEIL